MISAINVHQLTKVHDGRIRSLDKIGLIAAFFRYFAPKIVAIHFTKDCLFCAIGVPMAIPRLV